MAPGEFADAVRRSVEAGNAQVVIIDSLNGYLNAMPDERFLILQMHELLSYLSQRGVLTILVLAQHGLVGPMDTPLDISYLADGVLMLRYFEHDGSMRRAACWETRKAPKALTSTARRTSSGSSFWRMAAASSSPTSIISTAARSTPE